MTNRDRNSKCICPKILSLSTNPIQGHHGRFLAGKTPTVSDTSPACPGLVLFFKIQARPRSYLSWRPCYHNFPISTFLNQRWKKIARLTAIITFLSNLFLFPRVYKTLVILGIGENFQLSSFSCTAHKSGIFSHDFVQSRRSRHICLPHSAQIFSDLFDLSLHWARSCSGSPL